MMTYKPFSVVVVPFPFTDSVQVKKRPAIVLSRETHQKQTSHITLLMVTSAKHSEWYGDYEISDLVVAGLKSASIVRQKIFTIDHRLVLEKIGKLSKKDQMTVIKNTMHHLDLSLT